MRGELDRSIELWWIWRVRFGLKMHFFKSCWEFLVKAGATEVNSE